MNDEDFLSRWSRRKHAAEEASPEPLPPAPVSNLPKEEDAGSAAASEAESAGELDLSALPPLDSITSTTDVTAFLRKGVPQALTREALRRAWLADPAIRDFVGLAENAWDFNDPNAMPGFGPLDYTPEQVRDLVAKIVHDKWSVIEDDGASHAALPLQRDVVVPETTGPTDLSNHSTVMDVTAVDSAESPAVQAEEEISIVQYPSPAQASQENHDGNLPAVHRTHGRALPR